jgi:hypothetical protein
MSEKSFIKFQIRYLKSYLKYVSTVGKENKIIFNVKSRLIRQHNVLYKDVKNIPPNDIHRNNALVMMSAIETQLRTLYKSFDIDSRFVRKGSLYDKFPLYIRYKNNKGESRIHIMTENEQVTAAHILYNKLRNNKNHLKYGRKENEYIHQLNYWTDRLAFLFEEECARQIGKREFLDMSKNRGRDE